MGCKKHLSYVFARCAPLLLPTNTRPMILLPSAFVESLLFIQVISTWGVKNKIDFLSLSYTRHAEDVREVRMTQFYCICIGSAFFNFPNILIVSMTLIQQLCVLHFRHVTSYLSLVISARPIFLQRLRM